uniref:CCHC-type domain-containing protein n=1 Tax=Micrurus corallinus TaxID=54390 RepID=A0A2D4EJN5_MICCO
MMATSHLRGPPASRAPARRDYRGRVHVPRMPRCFNYNRMGHTSRDCPQRTQAPTTYQPRGTDFRRGSGRGQRRRGPKSDPDSSLLTLAIINDPEALPKYDRRFLWTLDSGAAYTSPTERNFLQSCMNLNLNWVNFILLQIILSKLKEKELFLLQNLTHTFLMFIMFQLQTAIF